MQDAEEWSERQGATSSVRLENKAYARLSPRPLDGLRWLKDSLLRRVGQKHGLQAAMCSCAGC